MLIQKQQLISNVTVWKMFYLKRRNKNEPVHVQGGRQNSANIDS